MPVPRFMVSLADSLRWFFLTVLGSILFGAIAVIGGIGLFALAAVASTIALVGAGLTYLADVGRAVIPGEAEDAVLGVAKHSRSGRSHRAISQGTLAAAAAILAFAGAGAAVGAAVGIGFGAAVAAAGAWLVVTVYGLERTYGASSGASEDERDIAIQRMTEGLGEFRYVDILRELTDEERRSIIALGERVHVSEGHLIARGGTAGDAVYVVLQGRAQLSADAKIGNVTVRIAGPGESFPLAALVGDGTLITTVRAMTDMQMWRVDTVRLNLFFSEHPTISAKIYRSAATVLAERYRRTLTQLTGRTEQALRDVDFWVNV